MLQVVGYVGLYFPAVLEVVVTVCVTTAGLEIRLADGGARLVEAPLPRRRLPAGEGESEDESEGNPLWAAGGAGAPGDAVVLEGARRQPNKKKL